MTSSAPNRDEDVSPWLHVFVAVWTVATIVYALFSEEGIPWLAMEDGVIEWITVALLALAAIIGIHYALRTRRMFDGLVGLFCFGFLGEEMSWGQRLLGFTPPDVFLEYNRQQEFNAHNFVPSRQYFLAAIIGYGIVMPLVARTAWGRRVMNRIGATPPQLQLLPWAAIIVVLTLWNPRKMTEECNEGLAALLFVAAVWRFRVRRNTGMLVGGVVTATALLATIGYLNGGLEPMRMECADMEIDALVDDLSRGDAASSSMRSASTMNQQIWLAVREKRIDLTKATKYQAIRCDRDAGGKLESRRHYGIDPWGLSYWVAVKGEGADRKVYVYSYGSDRRADGEPWERQGNDLTESAPFPLQNAPR